MNDSIDIKLIRSLSQKKYRDEAGLFVAEGEKMVQEALDSRFEVVRVIRKDEVGEKVMSRISMTSSPSPCLAVIRKPADSEIQEEMIHEYVAGKGLYLALDSIRDPGNLGTIIRTADWFGIDAVFASHDTVDIFNPKVVQSTMGAIFRVRFHYCSIPALCKAIKAAGGNVYGTFLDGQEIYSRKLNTGAESPALVITGNESNGISVEVGAAVTDRLYIPSYPRDQRGSESLNAAVATAITLSEFRRRS
jgi:TrmH family RNA methyltransferase